MAQIDRVVLKAVLAEYGAASACSNTSIAVLRLLSKLEARFGDDFRIDRACEALDFLIQDAEGAKQKLQKEKARYTST
jgi:hypothetical protein